MKKLLLSAIIGLFGVTAVAQDGEDENAQVIYGHVDDTNVSLGEGFGLQQDGTLGVAIRIPAAAIQQYKGGKIVGMIVAAADGCQEQEIRVFLKKGQITSEEYLLNQDASITWSPISAGHYLGDLDNIIFDQPWTIPAEIDEDIYLGLYSDVKARQNVIGVSMKNQSATAKNVYFTYSYEGNKEPNEWEDVATNPFIAAPNNPVIKAIIELPSENYKNVMMIENGFMPNICKADEYTTGLFYFKNDGVDPITSFEMTITCGEETVNHRYFFEEGKGLPSGKATTSPQPFQIPVFGTGHYTVEINKVNDAENTAIDKRKVEFDLVAVPAEIAAQHKRHSLYEYYTSETDHNSGGYMEDLIMPAVKKTNGHVILLPHHTGDKFIINPVDVPAIVEGQQDFITLGDGDYWAIKLCNDQKEVIMPSSTVDRTVQMSKIQLGGRSLARNPMGVGTITPQACDYIFPDALTTPTFASVELENKYNAENNSVEIKASGTIADLLPEGEKAKLSIFLIEETVVSDSQEFPESASSAERWPDGLFTHPRVIRQNVTDNFWGDELEPGQDFVKTYNVELESARWNPDHMKVIAVIQRPETNDHLHLDVLNATEEPMTENYEEPASINSIVVENNGKSGIYDLQGRKLTKAAKGINIINGQKVLVK